MSVVDLATDDGWPTQACLWLEWATLLAKALLRFQHSKLLTVCGEAPLHSSESGQGRIGPTPRGLGMEQFSPLQLAVRELCRSSRNRTARKRERAAGRLCPAVELPCL